MRPEIKNIPFYRFALVASSGLVCFLALWQGIFSLIHYRPCAIQAPSYVLPPNPSAALTEFALAITALLVLFVGARRLRAGFPEGMLAYSLVIASLLVGQGLLAFIFVSLSTCAS